VVDSTLISADTSISTLNRELVGYSIRRQIGHGAMGIVFEAEQKSLGRRVAIKVLPPNLALRERTVKRFLREAEAMGKLGHANIVDVYEVGSVRSTHFFSMKYVDGPPLDRVLKAGPLGVHDVLGIGIDVARALAHAHSRGVMHRDVKPGNLLRDGERVVLTDFGLARPLDGEDGSMTESGDLVGTPLYMSPEQISGDSEHIDGRSDVWGLGVTMYELLTQRAPFTALNAQGILHAILHREPPRLTKLRDDVPGDLEAVIHRCLEKDSSRRYSGAAALLEDLEAVRDGRAVTARTPRFFDPATRWMRNHPVEAGIVASSVLVMLIVALLARWGWTFYQEKLAGEQRTAQSATAEKEQAKADSQRAEAEKLQFRAQRTAASARVEISEARIARIEAASKAVRDERAMQAAESRVLDLAQSRALDDHPDIRAELLTLLAGWLKDRGHATSYVIAELERAIGNVDPGNTRLFHAAILTGLGDFTGALFVHGERASSARLDARPLLDAALVLRRMALASQAQFDQASFARSMGQALTFLELALERALRATDRDVTISILIERARCRLDVGDTQRAESDLLLALREDGTRVDAQSMLLMAERMSVREEPQRPPPLFDDPAMLDSTHENATSTEQQRPTVDDYRSVAQDWKKLVDLFQRLVPVGTPPPTSSKPAANASSPQPAKDP
jgi:predicted Ser/Thr protein kinase